MRVHPRIVRCTLRERYLLVLRTIASYEDKSAICRELAQGLALGCRVPSLFRWQITLFTHDGFYLVELRAVLGQIDVGIQLFQVSQLMLAFGQALGRSCGCCLELAVALEQLLGILGRREPGYPEE